MSQALSNVFKLHDVINVKDPAFGAKGDGVTEEAAKLQLALDKGGLIILPPGTYLVRSTLNPIANTVIQGAGRGRTIIKFQNTGATLGGIRAVNNLTIRDLTLQADVNGQTWCTSIIYSQACKDVFFDNVEFKGTTTKVGNWGEWISSASAENINHYNCHYELLTFGTAKDNADSSAQKNWNWTDCTADNVTDVYNINSPAGSWRHGTIKGAFCKNISQFPVAFAGANCSHWDVQVQGHDNEFELVHVEASAHDIDIHVSGYLNNKTAGTVGSPGAVNGAVQVITGSYDIRVSGSFDLRQNTTGSPNGVVVQPGGGAEPYNISVHNATFLCKAGTIGVFGQNIGQGTRGILDISECVFENETGSKSSKLIEVPFSRLSGHNNKFVNPGIVMNVDENSYGGLEASTFTGDLSTLDFLTGNSVSATSVVFQDFKLDRAFTVNAAADWQDVVPDGTLYHGLVSMRYIGNGASDSFTKTVELLADTGVLTIANEQANAVGGVDPNPGAPHWRISGGNLQSKAFRATSQTGQIIFTFQGPWYP